MVAIFLEHKHKSTDKDYHGNLYFLQILFN